MAHVTREILTIICERPYAEDIERSIRRNLAGERLAKIAIHRAGMPAWAFIQINA